MRIGELAELSGLNASRIRYYEAQGLIQTVQRQGNGYRHYSAQALNTLQIIQCAQMAGFSLEELKKLMPGRTGEGLKHEVLMEALLRKIAQIEEMQQHLAGSKAKLLGLIENIQARPDGMSCDENAERVLAALQHPL
ncbi:MerR family transcriptional regulator [Pseudomonas sp. SZMC_28357]|uniref:MerR family transcriptional regulator n=1 Tax=Pseudomonas sp. SZMC_28357 TaxID=3074380 RepID=UPI002870D7C8|nr:MerR family transcriptional regulator [Pseudomonas sp. SZMC_28357]MDR9752562.1 MerR family transcriptional regulator [Pseudomonas sp. SZMC_28357]